MKTYSFIGSDKNAGKTTALNYLYHQWDRKRSAGQKICLTSIGINGEAVDTYENKKKPSIRILRDTLFVTAGEHLRKMGGQYAVHQTFYGPDFPKPYILASALTDLFIVLEGPNEKSAAQKMKEAIAPVVDDGICFIDGSIDRQFLGHPSISDGICFALLLTARPEQQEKASDLLYALTLKPCPSEVKEIVDPYLECDLKSIFGSKSGNVIYQSTEVPFLDQQLKEECLNHQDEPCFLYLNGSLSRSLYDFLSPMEDLTVVLDNFTCFQNVSTDLGYDNRFKPRLVLYYSVPLTCLFIKQEGDEIRIKLPRQIPVYNLFRDNPDEIGI